MDRVFVDTNELYPFTVMDLVLALAERHLLRFVWTDELLDEWERVIVRDQRRPAPSAAAVKRVVATYFAESRIEPELYRNRTPPELDDPDDRIHAAAAIAGADVLLTRNTRDFPWALLPGVTVTSADDYLTRLYRHRRNDFLAAVVELASEKKNPPVSPCEWTERLANAGCPSLARALRRALGCS